MKAEESFALASGPFSPADLTGHAYNAGSVAVGGLGSRSSYSNHNSLTQACIESNLPHPALFDRHSRRQMIRNDKFCPEKPVEREGSRQATAPYPTLVFAL